MRMRACGDLIEVDSRTARALAQAGIAEVHNEAEESLPPPPSPPMPTVLITTPSGLKPTRRKRKRSKLHA